MALLWTVHPLETPRVVRRCRRCDEPTRFASSDRFRINAHQRRLDVWLVYRCTRCEASWNHALMLRVTPDALDPTTYEELLANAPARAWRCAFDLERLRRAGVRVDLGVPYRVSVDDTEGPDERVVFAVPYPVEVRFDRFVAERFGVSRAAVRRWVDRGDLSIERAALRRSIRDGQSFELVRPAEAI